MENEVITSEDVLASPSAAPEETIEAQSYESYFQQMIDIQMVTLVGLAILAGCLLAILVTRFFHVR